MRFPAILPAFITIWGRRLVLVLKGSPLQAEGHSAGHKGVWPGGLSFYTSGLFMCTG